MGKSKAKKPKTPDYKALAEQQASLNQTAADRAAAANRANQYTPEGSTEWSMDPTTGQWTNKVTLSPEQQYLHDQQLAQQAGLTETATDAMYRTADAWSKPFDTSGMTEVQGYDPSQLHAYGADLDPNADQMQKFDPSKLSQWGNLDYSSLGKMPESGFGAVKEVQDAILSRLRPNLDQQRAREMQRLKSQGFGETDEGMGVAQTRMNQRDVDAEMQALLGGAQEYGNIFNRGLQARQQGANELTTKANYDTALRGAQAGEQLAGAGFNNQILDTDFAQKQLASQYSNMLRGQQLAEQGVFRGASEADRAREMKEGLMQRNMPFQEYSALSGATGPEQPNFENYSQVEGGGAADIAGAANKQYQAEAEAYNAAKAQNAGVVGGLLKTVGGIAGSFFGPVGTAAGAALGGMLSPKAKTVPSYGGYSFSGNDYPG
jgi:hypothetical protein